GVGGAHYLAQPLHRVLALEGGEQHRTRGHVSHEVAEERPFLVLGVEALGFAARQAREPRVYHTEALAFDVRQDLSDQIPLDRVRLDDEQRAFHWFSSYLRLRERAARLARRA